MMSAEGPHISQAYEACPATKADPSLIEVRAILIRRQAQKARSKGKAERYACTPPF